jgi:NADH:ubiquinone oxidoreductase subunit E
MNTIDLKQVKEILIGFEKKNSSLIPALQAIEEEFGWVSKDAADLVANTLNIFPSKVYGVLTFYAQFHLKPRGKHLLRLCCGTACHVNGGQQLNERIQNFLQVQPGETTDDYKFTYQEVACLGCCGLAPVLTIGDNVHGKVKPQQLERILNSVD